jgi:hypothetical protein
MVRPVRDLTLQLCLAVLLLAVPPVWAEEGTEAKPEVRAVLIYAPGSPEYHDLFSFLLPELLDRYRGRLEISAFDASADSGSAAYAVFADRYGLPPQWHGSSTILVSDRAMRGLLEIAGALGDDFEQVAAIPGAGDWPPLPDQQGLLSAGMRDLDKRISAEAAPAVEEGFEGAPTGGTSTGARFANNLGLGVLAALGYFVIGATCLWCLGSAVSIMVVLWLLSGDTRKREVVAG